MPVRPYSIALRMAAVVVVATATLALLGFVTGAAPLAQAAAFSPVPLIIDTDIFTNADDVGALAAANALQDNGKVNLLGVMVDTPSRWGAPAVDAINTYYHHGNIPVGTHKPVDDSFSSPNYAQDLAENYPNSIHDGANAPEAVGAYRKILAAQPDHSVVIAAIGIETNLAGLLNSASDRNSPLNGAQLVAKKVRLLSMMGGKYPSGLEYNFVANPSDAVRVVNNWPTAAVFSGYEVGVNVLTGAKLSQTPAINPVRRAYEIWGGSGTDISSFDSIATVYAGLGTDGLFRLSAAGSNRVAADGSNQWQSTPVKDQHYLITAASVGTIADCLQALTTQAPSGTATASIAAYYQRLGGSNSYLGNLAGGEYVTAGGGKAQDYAGGSIYWSQASGAHAVHGAIVAHYKALGGTGGCAGLSDDG
jgi:hypothetical protein